MDILTRRDLLDFFTAAGRVSGSQPRLVIQTADRTCDPITDQLWIERHDMGDEDYHVTSRGFFSLGEVAEIIAEARVLGDEYRARPILDAGEAGMRAHAHAIEDGADLPAAEEAARRASV